MDRRTAVAILLALAPASAAAVELELPRLEAPLSPAVSAQGPEIKLLQAPTYANLFEAPAPLPELRAASFVPAAAAPVETKTTLGALTALGAASAHADKAPQAAAETLTAQYDGAQAVPRSEDAESPASHATGFARYAPVIENAALREANNRQVLDRYIDKLYPKKTARNLKAVAAGLDPGSLGFLKFASFVNALAPAARAELRGYVMRDLSGYGNTSQNVFRRLGEIDKALSRIDRRMAKLTPKKTRGLSVDFIMLDLVVDRRQEPDLGAALRDRLLLDASFAWINVRRRGASTHDPFMLADEELGIRVLNAAARGRVHVFGLMDRPVVADGREQDIIGFFRHDVGHAASAVMNAPDSLHTYGEAVAGLNARHRAMFDLIDFLRLHEASPAVYSVEPDLRDLSSLTRGIDRSAPFERQVMQMTARLARVEFDQYVFKRLKDADDLGALLSREDRGRLASYLREATAVWELRNAP